MDSHPVTAVAPDSTVPPSSAWYSRPWLYVAAAAVSLALSLVVYQWGHPFVALAKLLLAFGYGSFAFMAPEERKELDACAWLSVILGLLVLAGRLVLAARF